MSIIGCQNARCYKHILELHNISADKRGKEGFCALSEVLFILFVLFCSVSHAVLPTFPNIFVHDSYTVRRHLKVGAASTNPIARNVIVTSKFILIYSSHLWSAPSIRTTEIRIRQPRKESCMYYIIIFNQDYSC